MVPTQIRNIEDAYACIQHKQFGKAFTWLNSCSYRNTPAVHWGMLLASHQCPSVADLINLGIPINAEEHYLRTYNCSTAEGKAKWAETAQAILFSTQLKIYQHAVQEQDAYLTQIWIEHYRKACTKGDPLCAIHPHLQEYSEKKDSDEYVLGLVTAFYISYEKAIQQFRQTCKDQQLIAAANSLLDKATQMVKASFQAQMDHLYGILSTPYIKKEIKPAKTAGGPVLYRSLESYQAYVEDFRYQLEKSGMSFVLLPNESNRTTANAARDLWVDPCSAYNNSTGSSVSVIDFDGCGKTVGERWFSLAEKLWNGPHKEVLATYEAILHMYDQAEKAGVDAVKVRACREKMLTGIMESKDLNKLEIEFVLNAHPESPAPYWKYLSIKTEDFVKTSECDYSTHNVKPIDIENTPLRKLSMPYLRNSIKTLQANLEMLEPEKTKWLEKLQPYADKVFAFAKGDAAKDYQHKWKAYLQKVDTDFTQMQEKILSRISRFEQVCKKKASRKKTALIVGLILILVVIGVVIALAV